MTKLGTSREAVYVLVDELGELVRAVRLTGTPTRAVKLAPFGKHLLLVWQEESGRTKLALIDALGRKK